MKKINIYITFIAYATAILLQSCSWFDVGSQSDRNEDEMFETTEGYYTSLTGLYINMGTQKLYGGNLPLLALEPLTQQYTISDDEPDRLAWSQMNYATDYGEKTIADIWLSMYNTIVNDNLLLSKMNTNANDMLSEDIAQIMKGEALGLRAFMYFDLIRMFNDSWETNSSSSNVPFKTDFGFALGKKTSTEVLLDSLTSNLVMARNLLKHDPICGNNSYNNKYLNYNRNERMNYYACTALLARIELYRQNYQQAANYAMEVINSGKFRFINESEILKTNIYGVEEEVDRLFMPEMIFALYNENILAVSRTHLEGLSKDFIKSTEAYSESDVRQNWFFKNPSANNKINLIRYQRSTLSSDSYKYKNPVVPMLKLSEMYLIAAECALNGVTSCPTAVELLNTLKEARKAIKLNTTASQQEIWQEITHEYICDFKGEGQLFYYYKRRNMTTVDDGYYGGNTFAIRSEQYTLPLPEYEKQFNLSPTLSKGDSLSPALSKRRGSTNW